MTAFLIDAGLGIIGSSKGFGCEALFHLRNCLCLVRIIFSRIILTSRLLSSIGFPVQVALVSKIGGHSLYENFNASGVSTVVRQVGGVQVQ